MEPANKNCCLLAIASQNGYEQLLSPIFIGKYLKYKTAPLLMGIF